MKFFRYRRPSWKTVLGVTKAKKRIKKELGITVLLIVLCIIVAVLNPRFLGASNLTNMARLIGMYGIFSIGVGLVIITAGIDLSLGSVFALQGVILAIMLREWNLAWPLAVLLVVIGVMLLGATHGWFIGYVRMQPFIVTLCGLLFYRGLARFIANDETKGFGSSGFELLRTLATGSIGPVPMPFVLLIIVGIITYVLLHHSVFGRYLYAVGSNAEAARLSGVPVPRMTYIAYGLSSMLAAGSDDYTWAAAASGSNNAAGYQLGSGAPVMAIGGFNGTDPAPTLDEFKRYVADKKIHYFIRGQMMIGQWGLHGASGSREAAEIAEWVETRFTPITVDKVVIYDLTAPAKNT